MDVIDHIENKEVMFNPTYAQMFAPEQVVYYPTPIVSPILLLWWSIAYINTLEVY